MQNENNTLGDVKQAEETARVARTTALKIFLPRAVAQQTETKMNTGEKL